MKQSAKLLSWTIHVQTISKGVDNIVRQRTPFDLGNAAPCLSFLDGLGWHV